MGATMPSSPARNAKPGPMGAAKINELLPHRASFPPEHKDLLAHFQRDRPGVCGLELRSVIVRLDHRNQSTRARDDHSYRHLRRSFTDHARQAVGPTPVVELTVLTQFRID